MFTNMDHIKLYLSNYFKTGNIVYDMFITSFMIFIAAMFSNINMFDIQYLLTNVVLFITIYTTTSFQLILK